MAMMAAPICVFAMSTAKPMHEPLPRTGKSIHCMSLSAKLCCHHERHQPRFLTSFIWQSEGQNHSLFATLIIHNVLLSAGPSDICASTCWGPRIFQRNIFQLDAVEASMYCAAASSGWLLKNGTMQVAQIRQQSRRISVVLVIIDLNAGMGENIFSRGR